MLLTALFEICYYNSMEQNTLELNERIARNLALYRKRAGMTQAELAERINYSDKSVSKWESGNGVPDIYILVQLAEIFGVTVNDLVAEEPPKGAPRRENVGLHTMIMALSSGIVWLVATCVLVGNTSSPISALMKDDLPFLTSPQTTTSYCSCWIIAPAVFTDMSGVGM